MHVAGWLSVKSFTDREVKGEGCNSLLLFFSSLYRRFCLLNGREKSEKYGKEEGQPSAAVFILFFY
jgi:hypothetical protein